MKNANFLSKGVTRQHPAEEMKLCVILGAGASAAINPERIPVMNDFFEKAADFAQQSKEIASTLETLREFKLISNKQPNTENLEDVLTKAISLPRTRKDTWKRPYDGLLLTLHRIFHELDKEDLSHYIDCLSPISSLEAQDIAFISFNYDLFLEKALENLFDWSADFGYAGNALVGYINAEQAEHAMKPEQVCDEVYAWPFDISPTESFPSTNTIPIQLGTGPLLLKPHGSLNWFVHSAQNYPFWMSEKTRGFLLMRQTNSKVHVPSLWDYPTTNTVEGETADRKLTVGAVLPAIVPPGKKFSASIPPFQKVEKAMADMLGQADALILIGWSMRQTDTKFEDFFGKVAKYRKKMLRFTAVCSLNQKEEFFERFRNLFPTQELLHSNKGFVTPEAKELLERAVKISREPSNH